MRLQPTNASTARPKMIGKLSSSPSKLRRRHPQPGHSEAQHHPALGALANVTVSREALTWHGAPEAAVGLASVVTIDDVRSVATDLPRSYEVVVRGRVKFRVGRIVYLDFSRDQSIMGFAFPREWRPVLVSSAPDKFMLPIDSELRWNWVRVRLAAIDMAEMR